MPEFKDLHVEEGLFHRDFVIKGDQDYIDLCDNLMFKYKEMEKNLITLNKNYVKLQSYLSSLESNSGYNIYFNKLISIWSKDKYFEGISKLKEANNKIILLKKKEKLLKIYYQKLLNRENENESIENDNQKLKDKNKYLREKINFLKLKNRNLRIKFIKHKIRIK